MKYTTNPNAPAKVVMAAVERLQQLGMKFYVEDRNIIVGSKGRGPLSPLGVGMMILIGVVSLAGVV